MQTLKDETRTCIRTSATACFLSNGYMGSTMADIAAKAGISVGNMYRYYKTKDDLFYEVVNPALVEKTKIVLKSKFEAWSVVLSDRGAVTREAQAASAAMIDYLIANRTVIVIALERSAGTRYEGLKGKLADHLVDLYIRYCGKNGEEKRGGNRDLMRLIYVNLMTGFCELLGSTEDEKKLADSLGSLMQYHLGGIGAF